MCDHDQDDSQDRPPSKNDSTQNSADHRFRYRQGWVIEGRRTCDGSPTGRFLQIGTGQWCPQQYATVFPLRQTAVIYAQEFGYSIGHSACVVRYCDHE